MNLCFSFTTVTSPVSPRLSHVGFSSQFVYLLKKSSGLLINLREMWFPYRVWIERKMCHEYLFRDLKIKSLWNIPGEIYFRWYFFPGHLSNIDTLFRKLCWSLPSNFSTSQLFKFGNRLIERRGNYGDWIQMGWNTNSWKTKSFQPHVIFWWKFYRGKWIFSPKNCTILPVPIDSSHPILLYLNLSLRMNRVLMEFAEGYCKRYSMEYHNITNMNTWNMQRKWFCWFYCISHSNLCIIHMKPLHPVFCIYIYKRLSPKKDVCSLE